MGLAPATGSDQEGEVSDVTWVEADAPGLRPGETAYQVDETTVMAVRVRRREPPEPEFVSFGVTARLIDGATGESCQCVADTPLEAPENTVTIPLDMVAHEQVDLESEVEDAKRRAVQRVLRMRAALQCLDVLPDIPD